MPVLKKSNYTSKPWYLFNRHWETVVPSVCFRTKGVDYERERITLPDDDFLDLDWLKAGNFRLMILSHGLEGNSTRQYMARPAKYFYERGWDVLAWNCRGCSGEVNRALRTYQHGDIEDIGAVINHALSKEYGTIALVGYSMGGNMTLKYLGKQNESLNNRIKAAVVFSVPCNLEDSSDEIGKPANKFYEKRFLKKLRKKIALKIHDHPSLDVDWELINDFSDFNKYFTLPVFGFSSEREFLNQARTDHLLPEIRIPTLIVNAQNDPMLNGRNYPYETVEKTSNVVLETPQIGGHVGFSTGWNKSYMETRTEEFLRDVIQ